MDRVVDRVIQVIEPLVFLLSIDLKINSVPHLNLRYDPKLCITPETPETISILYNTPKTGVIQKAGYCRGSSNRDSARPVAENHIHNRLELDRWISNFDRNATGFGTIDNGAMKSGRGCRILGMQRG